MRGEFPSSFPIWAQEKSWALDKESNTETKKKGILRPSLCSIQ